MTAEPAPDVAPDAARVLLIIVVPGATAFDDLATGLLELGVAGTVLESKGLMTLMREEMPFFGGLAAMLPGSTGSKVVLSLTTRGAAAKVLELIEHEFPSSERPIACTVAIDASVGLRP